MSLFFETIFISDKKIRNLIYHNRRLNNTIRDNFKIETNYNLTEFIELDHKGEMRCKVIYDTEIKDVQYFKIQEREFKSFKIIYSDIEYRYKYLNRESIDRLYRQKDSCDDIIIVDKRGFLKDTSIANIALYEDDRWITPKNPLLKGTMRQSLIDKQLILEKDVKIEQLKNTKRFAIFNAVIGFLEIDNVTFI